MPDLTTFDAWAVASYCVEPGCEEPGHRHREALVPPWLADLVQWVVDVATVRGQKPHVVVMSRDARRAWLALLVQQRRRFPTLHTNGDVTQTGDIPALPVRLDPEAVGFMVRCE